MFVSKWRENEGNVRNYCQWVDNITTLSPHFVFLGELLADGTKSKRDNKKYKKIIYRFEVNL